MKVHTTHVFNTRPARPADIKTNVVGSSSETVDKLQINLIKQLNAKPPSTSGITLDVTA